MKPYCLMLSHGNMAIETLKSGEMIAGKQSTILALSFSENDSVESLRDEVNKIIESHVNDQLIVMVDLHGGTPFNTVVNHVLKAKNIKLMTGLNLPLLLEYIFSSHEDLDELSKHLELVGQDSIHILDAVHDTDDEIEF